MKHEDCLDQVVFRLDRSHGLNKTADCRIISDYILINELLHRKSDTQHHKDTSISKVNTKQY